MDKEERNKRIIEVMFDGGRPETQAGWGWYIPRNPNRQTPGELTAEESAYKQILDEGTIQTREEYRTKTYAYWSPFQYPNVTVELGRPGTGTEFNMDGAEIDIYPYGFIAIEEDEPIVAVTVIGSGCCTDSYVVLEAEPIVWQYPRTGVRMRRHGLWGMHVRYDAWRHVGERWNDAGLSSARFDIPESRRVIVGGGSHGADPHYCIRTVRIEIREDL